MTDLGQPTTALSSITQARDFFSQYSEELQDAHLALSQYQDALPSLTQAKGYLLDYISELEDTEEVLAAYHDTLVDPSSGSTTVQQRKDALTQFKICLETDSSVSVGEGWDKAERVEQAYLAVWNMIQTISSEMFSNDNLLGTLQFVRSFHGTRLHLVQDTLPSGALATTVLADRDEVAGAETSVISLYTGTTGDIVHSPENIVHEFGHVILDQNREAMYDDWEATRINFSRNGSVRNAITVSDGWVDPTNRENTFAVDQFPECTNTAAPCLELEIERIADMFLFWVYQNDSTYDFDVNNTDNFIQDVAIAFQNFVNTEGASWSRTVGGVTVNFTSQGMAYWLTNAATLNISVDCNVP